MRVVEDLVHSCMRHVEIVRGFRIPALAGGRYPKRLWRRALGEKENHVYEKDHKGGD